MLALLPKLLALLGRPAVSGEWAFGFAAPELLGLGLLALPCAWWASRRSLSGLSPGRQRAALGVRLLVLTGLILALAELEWRGPAPEIEAVLVVDRSRSIPAEGHLREAVDATRRRAEPALRPTRVVSFGADAVNEAELRSALPFHGFRAVVDREGTNLERALRRGLDSLGPGGGRLVLLSDGNQTAGEAKRAAAAARLAGVPIDVVPIDYHHERELAIEKVVVPSEVAAGEPFAVRVLCQATHSAPATISLWRDGHLVANRAVVLEPGTSLHTFELEQPEPGFARIEASLRHALGDDSLSQNDLGHAFVLVRGEARVLYVAGEDPLEEPDARRAGHLVAALRAARIEVEERGPGELPLRAGELQAYQAVVLDDVPRRACSERQVSALERAVRDQGLGLVVIGGPNAFGPGDWEDTPLAKALPVRLSPPGQGSLLSSALVLVLDTSGSMAGHKLELTRRAAAATGRALGARDELGVVRFSGDAHWALTLAAGHPRARLSAALSKLEAAGGTQLGPGLALAARALRASEAQAKHVILLSDGRADDVDRAARLARALRARKVTLSTVGIGEGADAPSLRRLAQLGGGRHLAVADARDLRQVFVKEARRALRPLIVERTVLPQRVGAGDLLAGLGPPPPLRGFVRTFAKAQAEVSLATPGGAPLLAHWRYGLGRVLAFTSDVRPRWAPEWIEWKGFQAAWSQLLRLVSKDVAQERFQLQARAVGGEARIALDAIDAEGQLLDGLRVRARLEGPRGEVRQAPLLQTGPGRYELKLPLVGAGTHELQLVSEDASGRVLHSQTTGLIVPYAPEFRDLRSDRPTLESLARATGGRVLELDALRGGEADLWTREGVGERERQRAGWPTLLALALFLFLLDVALRRVHLDLRALLPRPEPRPKPSLPVAATAHLLEARRSRVASEELAPPSTPPPAPVARPSPQPDRAAPPPPTAGGSLDRLLAAKRRAQRDAEGEG